jgi:hypothetical protein
MFLTTLIDRCIVMLPCQGEFTNVGPLPLASIHVLKYIHKPKGILSLSSGLHVIMITLLLCYMRIATNPLMNLITKDSTMVSWPLTISLFFTNATSPYSKVQI